MKNLKQEKGTITFYEVFMAPATAEGDKYFRPCKGFVVLAAWELHE